MKPYETKFSPYGMIASGLIWVVICSTVLCILIRNVMILSVMIYSIAKSFEGRE